MSNLLYYYGMCGLLKECLLYRYFSKVLNISLLEYHYQIPHSWNMLLQIFLSLYQEVRGGAEVPESDIVQACRRVSA